jgi:excisionase family DNA binding protein
MACMNANDATWTLKTLHDSAAQLAVSKSTVRRLIRAGKLAAVHVGGRCLVDSRDIDDFVAQAKGRGGAR